MPENDQTPIVDLVGLRIQYGSGKNAHIAVDGVDLAVHPGEIVAVVGESGSGKSTLVSAILGLLSGSASVIGGALRIDGRDATGWNEADWRSVRGSRIGLVPQDPMSNLDPVLRVGTQVDEGARAHRRLSRSETRQETERAFTRAGLPDAASRRRHYPHQFSGGMRQRALIAMASVNSPGLLIADEPTSALDVTVQRRILDNLAAAVVEFGTAVLLVTHDLALAAERADRIFVMRRGVVVESGSAAEVFGSPAHEYTQALLASVPSARTPRPVRQGGDTVLAVQGIDKHFGDVRAVDGVSFTIERGKTLALVGESGSGKSTTAWTCLGLHAPDNGLIVFDGKDVSTLKGRELRDFRRRVQPIFQDPYASLDPTYTVDRILREPLTAFKIGDRASRRRRAVELLERVGLPATTLRRRPSELSGGQRQRVAIARALAAEPELIVCDEPVSALDVLVQAQVLDLLQTLQNDLGLTYLFISHDLGVVRQIADDVAVMTGGRIVEQGPTAEVFDSPAHDYTRTLLDAVPGMSSIAPVRG